MQSMTADGPFYVEESNEGTGSSLDRAYQNQIWRRLITVMVVPLLIVQLAVYEWMKAILADGGIPVGLTLMAALAAGYAAFRVRPLERRLAASVGNAVSAGLWRLEEILAGFEKRGMKVVHDYPLSSGESVPVLVLGKSGMYAIWIDRSRAISSQAVDVFQRCDGGAEAVYVNGFEVFGDPLRRAALGASGMRQLIQGGANPDCYVQPVFVVPRGRTGEPPVGAVVAVVDEAGLKAQIESGKDVLDAEGIDLIYRRLMRRKELRKS